MLFVLFHCWNYYSYSIGITINLACTVEPLLWGHLFFTRKVAFQEGRPLVRGSNQYICLDLQCLVAFTEGVASHQGGLSKGVPLYYNNIWCSSPWDNWSIINTAMELAWHSGSVMDCHAKARGLIPGGYRVKTNYKHCHDLTYILLIKPMI